MKKISIMTSLVLMLLFSSQSVITAETDEVLPLTPYDTVQFTGSQKTVRYGDTFITKFSGLSFKNPEGLKNIIFSPVTERVDSSQELQKIVIPAITADTNLPSNRVGIRIMAMIDDNAALLTVKDIVFNSGDDVITIERAELLEWIGENNEGQFPLELNFLIVHLNEDGSLNSAISNEIYELHQRAPIEFHTKVVDGLTFRNRIDQIHQGVVRWYIEDSRNPTKKTLATLPRFETSDISVSADKYEDLVPGEIVNLTFTVQNKSRIKNNYAWIGFETDALEIEEADGNTLDWHTLTGELAAPLVIDDSWQVLNQGDTHTFTQTFRIAEDYTGDSITIDPYIFINAAIMEKETNPGITLRVVHELVVEEETNDMQESTEDEIHQNEDEAIEIVDTMIEQESDSIEINQTSTDETAHELSNLYDALSVEQISESDLVDALENQIIETSQDTSELAPINSGEASVNTENSNTSNQATLPSAGDQANRSLLAVGLFGLGIVLLLNGKKHNKA